MNNRMSNDTTTHPVGALVVGPFDADGRGWPQTMGFAGPYGPGLGIVAGHRNGYVVVDVLTGGRMSGGYYAADLAVVKHPQA